MSDLSEDSSPEALPSAESLYFFEGISWTPQIEDATQLVALWINCDHCGASLWGLPRVGKSEFAKYFEKVANEMFGGTVVVIRLRFGGRKFLKEEQFLKRALSNVGVRATGARDQEALIIRLMDEIWSRCTPATRRIVVIGDELQNVAVELYGLFAIIETEISERLYIPFLLCIGQPELQSTVANVEKNLHIMGRQFQELSEFRGLSFDQIAEFLSSLEDKDRVFSKRHFATRAVSGWSVIELVQPIREAVYSICDLEKMNLELFFPMGYLRQTLNYLFFFLIDEAHAHEDVSAATVLESFERNGFKRVMMSYVKPKEAPKAVLEASG